MKNILNILKIINFDLVSKFNYIKKNLLLKIKNIIIFIKLKTVDSDFLINFLVISKIIYFWFKQKLNIFFFKKEYFKGSRNNLNLILGINLKKLYINKFLNYFNNIILYISKNIDNSMVVSSKGDNLLLNFSNLNYILGLNINKYYKYNLSLNILLKFTKNSNNSQFYEKIFI